MNSDDTLGVHRPYFDRKYFGDLSASEAEINYKNVTLKVKAYLSEMGLRNDTIDSVLKVPSDDIRYYSVSEFNSSIGKFEPHFEEWIIARCLEYPPLKDTEKSDLNLVIAGERFQKIMTKEEFDKYVNLPEPTVFRQFTQYSEGYKSYLKKTNADRKKCVSNSIVSDQASTAELIREMKGK